MQTYFRTSGAAEYAASNVPDVTGGLFVPVTCMSGGKERSSMASGKKKVKNNCHNVEYVCYCSKVTEKMIAEAVRDGADSPEKVIAATGAMKNSNCKVNNPKGT